MNLKIYLLAVLMITPLVGAPFFGEIHYFNQPDGSRVPVRLYGDEFYIRGESLEGYTVIRNKETGYLSYADLNREQSKLIPSRDIYRGQVTQKQKQSASFLKRPKGQKLSKESRAQIIHSNKKASGAFEFTEPSYFLPPASADVTRENPQKVLGILILVSFPDVPPLFQKQELDDMANLPGYTQNFNNGSIRDYFLDVSSGKLDYTMITMDYYQAKNPKAYYDSDDRNEGSKELIKEALAALDDSFDFSSLTLTAENTVLALNVMYTGAWGEVWAQGLWPHRGTLYDVSLDGVGITRYQITGIKDELQIGTMIHESGHLLFNWPDLYDYDSDSQGVGKYCLMASQDYYNPQMPNAYLRVREGWESAIDITHSSPGTKFSLTSNGTTNYVYKNANNPVESFYLESAFQTGRRDEVPDEGLMIWHVDEYGINSNNEGTFDMHFRVALEQSDNKFDLENNQNLGDATDLFHAGGNHFFSDVTFPNSKWWDESYSGLNIINISPAAEEMSFEIGGSPKLWLSLTDGSGSELRSFSGGYLFLGELPPKINFKANVYDEIKSVSYKLSGAESLNGSSNTSPFLAFPTGFSPPAGSYSLEVTAFSQSEAGGSEVFSRTYDFFIRESFFTFQLVNTETDKEIMEITDNTILDLDTLPPINILAYPAKPVKSLYFKLSGTLDYERNEWGLPYTLFYDTLKAPGASRWDYDPWVEPKLGGYTMQTIAYSDTNATGDTLGMATIRFRLSSASPIKDPIEINNAEKITMQGKRLLFWQPKKELLEIAITDVKGKLHFHTKRQFSEGPQDLQWTSTKPGAGLFFIYIKGNKGTVNSQLVLIK